jgi:hypothetical protein
MEKLLTIIDGPRLTTCNFATKPIGKVKNRKIAVNLDSESKFAVDDKKSTAIISWSIQSDTVGVPFKFDIEVEALFKVTKPATQQEIIEAGTIEAGPLLFVLLRNIIADLTLKADLTPFYPNYPDFSKLATVKEKARRISKKKRTL